MPTKKKKAPRALAGTKKRRRSPLQTAYDRLKKVKTRNCNGKASAADVKKAAKTYIDRAVGKGQTRKEATRKANAITSRTCAK